MLHLAQARPYTVHHRFAKGILMSEGVGHAHSHFAGFAVCALKASFKTWFLEFLDARLGRYIAHGIQ